jgi:hypothetical protein
VSNLARGHYEDFSIDRLLRFLKALGFDVKIVLEPTEKSVTEQPWPGQSLART